MDVLPVGLAGDWHGHERWSRHTLTMFAERGLATVLHMGDFGIWPGYTGHRFVKSVEEGCRRHDIRLYVTPGNHDDYDQIGELPLLPDPGGLGEVQRLTEQISVLPRGHRFSLNDRSFVSLGGAPSVDFPWRIEGETWWPAEMVTDDDVARTVAGGHAEVMLAHDAPDGSTPAVGQIIDTNPGRWPDRCLDYARKGRERMNAAFAGVLPQVYVHGHFHVRAEAVVPHSQVPGASGDRECRFVALAGERHRGNLAALDLDDLSVTGWTDEYSSVCRDPFEREDMKRTDGQPDGVECWVCGWEAARTLSDHSNCMIKWLRGSHLAWPGHDGPPDGETARLTHLLVQINAAGLVTVGSQPAITPYLWRQRAFLDGYGPRKLVDHVVEVAKRQGFIADAWDSDWTVEWGQRHAVTTWCGRETTWTSRFGLADVLFFDETHLGGDALVALEGSRSFYIIDHSWDRGEHEADTMFQNIAKAAREYVYQRSVAAWPEVA